MVSSCYKNFDISLSQEGPSSQGFHNRKKMEGKARLLTQRFGAVSKIRSRGQILFEDNILGGV